MVAAFIELELEKGEFFVKTLLYIPDFLVVIYQHEFEFCG